MQKGTKYDKGKARFELLPFREIEQVVDVLTHGSIKYEDHNWKYVVPRSRYVGAAFRHLWARVRGEITDKDSGRPHLAHAICCLLFLMWADNEGEKWTC